VQGIADRSHERALLKLIAEYAERGEHITTATTSRTHAGKVLRQEPSFPARLKDPEVFDLLRKAERAGYLERATYKGADRKPRECWEVTPAGLSFAGCAATAATAATCHVTADGAHAAEPAATAATSPLGGMGEIARTPKSMERSA
jgi:putative DNA primase/helicase